MALVIHPLGTVSNLEGGRAGDATWNEGCLHIRQRARSVVVSIDFDRFTAPAMAAALYELADMEPGRICLMAGENRITEVVNGFEPACRRICEIFVNTGIREEFLIASWLSSGNVHQLDVTYQSGNKS